MAGSLLRRLAEREGFEPSDRCNPVNTLAVCPNRPLWHLSVVMDAIIMNEFFTLRSSDIAKYRNSWRSEGGRPPCLPAGRSGTSPCRASVREKYVVSLVCFYLFFCFTYEYDKGVTVCCFHRQLFIVHLIGLFDCIEHIFTYNDATHTPKPVIF